MAEFLFEVGLEEIPARMIAPAQSELAGQVNELLKRERLLESVSETKSYSTPRRLAVSVTGVLAKQSDIEEHLTGPSWSIAFKNGEATPAAHAFAKKAGVEVTALQKITNAKGEYVSARVLRSGRSASDVLAEQLPKELAALYWPKNMYWRAGKPERFVRPVKWLLALLGHAIVPVEFAGAHAANLTYGHRILHGDKAVTIDHPSEYKAALESVKVLVDVEGRRHKIRKALDAATRAIPGLRWREDTKLVDDVTHLTEWPSVLLGGFEPEYLTLPEEVLVTVMRDHQKYFAVEDAESKLAPHFLAVLNTEADEQGIAVIRHGNERVLRARFNDARFFWDFDQKVPLRERVELLKSVTFQKDLGSYYDKTSLTTPIALGLADDVLKFGIPVDTGALLEASLLAKADLTSELVKEFTELQGIIGGLYARAQGFGETVAQAIYAQYMPASTEDSIPATVEGQILGLADRLQTVAAMFAIGLEPTGSKDPFALRRSANGVVKILAESRLPLHISGIIRIAINQIDQSARAGTNVPTLAAFFRDRVEFYLRDVCGYSYDVVNAVLASGADDLPDVLDRAKALAAVRGSADFAAISAAFKRMKNILRQAGEKFQPADVPANVDEKALTESAERALYQHAGKLASAAEQLRGQHKYREALEQIATLRPHVDLFFDKVMVMTPDEKLRRNRLALIAKVLSSFSSIADFSEIVAE